MLCKTEPVAKMVYVALLALGGCAQNWDGHGVRIGECDSRHLWSISDGLYSRRDTSIVIAADGLCLDYEFNKGIIILHSCHGGNNQKWTWDHDFAIRNSHDGKCLEVRGQYLALSPCAGRPSQKFAAVPNEFPLLAPAAALDKIATTVLLPGLALLFFFAERLLSFCKNSRQSGEQVEAQGKTPIDTSESKTQQKLVALEKVMATIDTKMTHMTTVLEGQGAEDSCSDCTVGSWTHVTEESCCFVPDTFLKKATNVGLEFVAVQTLFRGAQVVAANGTVIEVLRPPEQHQVDAVIELQAGPSCLIVTPDHRIVIPGNKTVQAKDLEVGCDVLLDQARTKLTSLEWRLEPTMVLKVSFNPDLPVAGFLRPPAILSKGTREKPVVRRATKKPGKVEDNPTIPDTEPPLTP